MTKRIGLLVPSSNTVMEVDLSRGIGDAATLHTARMFLEETTPEAESEMLDIHAMPAAASLGTARPDVIVFGCTSAGALRGNDYDAELCWRMEEETGVAVVSVIASVRAAIGAYDVRRIGVVTPYVDALNDRIRASLEDDGLDVRGIFGLGITENFAIASVTPPEIVELATRSFRPEEIDLLFVSCTNFRAIEALAELSERFGLPVVTSNEAAMGAALAAVGLPEEG
jgi:maleate isomerase